MSDERKRATPQDIYYYRPLHIWAKCAGILPSFDLNHLQSKSHRIYLHGVIMAITFCCIYVYSTYGKVTHMTNVFAPSAFMTDIGGDAALFITNVASIVRISLVKAKHIRKFLDHLKKIDAELRSIREDIRYPRKVFLIEFICTNIVFVIYYIYDASIWVSSVTWHTYRWYFLRDLQCFHMLILSLVVRNYSLAIRNRVRILNEILIQMKPPEDDPGLTNTSLIHVMNSKNALAGLGGLGGVNKGRNYERIKKTHWQVQRMRRIYARICVSMGIYNEIFGWIYLVLYVAIVVYLCTSSNIALVYGIGNRKMGNSDFGVALIILCILWSALPLIVGFFIFSSADKVFFEIKRTPIICYSIIDGWLPFDEEHVLVPELEKFAQQVTNSHPEITAAGFFAVDYAIFFALIGSLSSYLIVLIQFM